MSKLPWHITLLLKGVFLIVLRIALFLGLVSTRLVSQLIVIVLFQDLLALRVDFNTTKIYHQVTVNPRKRPMCSSLSILASNMVLKSSFFSYI